MTAIGGVIALFGMLLFHRALGITLRANPKTQIPFWRKAAVHPVDATVLRAVGTVLLVVGALLLSTTGWYWPFLVALIGPGAALLAVTAHNRQVERHR